MDPTGQHAISETMLPRYIWDAQSHAQPDRPAGDGPPPPAPEHLVEMLARVVRGPGDDFPGDPAEHVAIVRQSARTYVELIWREAWTMGAAWGLARNTQPIRIEPEAFERLRESCT